MFKRLYIGLLITLLVITPIAPYLDVSVFAADKAKIPPGTYNIADIKLIDIGSHPTTVAEVKQLASGSGNFSQRTGYSFYILSCDYTGSYDENGKKKKDANGNEINPWSEKINDNSRHQDNKDVFTVDGMEARVLAAFTAAYGAELAPLLMDYMKEKNIEMGITRTEHRVSGSFDGINYKDSNPANNSAHCSSDNDEAFFYQDDDVYLGASFTIPKGSCKDEDYAKENPEECGTCEDEEYAEAHKEECDPPPGCEDPEYAAANPEKCNPPPPVPTCEKPTPATIKDCGGQDEKLIAKTIPEAYTELKHNTVHQEKWEAMAGIPTTENLYYSVGGSEYMVQVELTSRKGNHVQRTYDYIYESTPHKAQQAGMVTGKTTKTGWMEDQGEALQIAKDSRVTQTPIEDLDGRKILIESYGTDEKCVDGYWPEYVEAVAAVAPSGTPGTAGYSPGSPAEPGYQPDYVCTKYNYQGWIDGYAPNPAISYSWHQDVYFDYVEITKAKVWKIDNGVITGLSPMSGTDSVKATIKLGSSDGVISHLAGHPGNAASGRLRYTFEQPQASVASGSPTGPNPFACEDSSNYDAVVCKSKIDDRTVGNSAIDGPQLNVDCDACNAENYWIFGEGTATEPEEPGVMKKKNKVTVLSDVLVLTTADGYESVIYFEQTDIPETERLIDHFEYVKKSGGASWGSNNNIGSWPLNQATTVVSYNSEYYNMADKYTSRPRSPSHGYSSVPNSLLSHNAEHAVKQSINTGIGPKNIEIYADGIDIVDTFGNGDFQAGPSIVEYVPIFQHNASEYQNTQDKYNAEYTQGYGVINKVVIHNPVGVRYAYVVGTPNRNLDRRTGASLSSSNFTYGFLSPPLQLGHKPVDEASFISLEGVFDIKFPNIGDFPQNSDFAQLVTQEGKGPMFTNLMDTTLWTKSKWVKFPFDVIYGGAHYPAMTAIQLSVPQTDFRFYVPLNNNEHISGRVEFWAEAINANDRSDGGGFQEFENYNRYTLNGVTLAAQHRTMRADLVDVVGNIGNLTVVDTGDYRWSEYFKQPKTPTSWFIKNLVKNVDPSKQNKIMGDQVDIFLCTNGNSYGGNLESAGCVDNGSVQFMDSHNTEAHKNQLAEKPALTPDKNPNVALKQQPIRKGYQTYLDVETTGNYGNGKVTVNVGYNLLDLQTGQMSNIDIYDLKKRKYELIYDGGTNSGTKKKSPIAINWSAEKERRNYKSTEKTATEASVGVTGWDRPRGVDYIYGTTDRLVLGARNRTFNGNTVKRDLDQNPGGVDVSKFYEHGQRWHFQTKLPSSSVLVKDGEPLTEENIKKYQSERYVIVVSSSIQSDGDVWSLQYDGSYSNGTVDIDGYPIRPITPGIIPDPPGPKPLLIEIISNNKTTADDMSVVGTH